MTNLPLPWGCSETACWKLHEGDPNFPNYYAPLHAESKYESPHSPDTLDTPLTISAPSRGPERSNKNCVITALLSSIFAVDVNVNVKTQGCPNLGDFERSYIFDFKPPIAYSHRRSFLISRYTTRRQSREMVIPWSCPAYWYLPAGLAFPHI